MMVIKLENQYIMISNKRHVEKINDMMYFDLKEVSVALPLPPYPLMVSISLDFEVGKKLTWVALEQNQFKVGVSGIYAWAETQGSADVVCANGI